VDDGSTDRTAGVARRFASKEVKVVSKANQSLSAAVNHAFRLGQDDYIQELDSDDIYHPTRSRDSLPRCGKVIASEFFFPHGGPTSIFGLSVRASSQPPLWHDLSPMEWLP